MQYSTTITSPGDQDVLSICDQEIDSCNPSWWLFLTWTTIHPNLNSALPGLPRTPVCILAEIGDKDSIPILRKILKHDINPLVRHEAAFTMGQLGYDSATDVLVYAMLNDDNVLVRHESAAALGSVGDESSRRALVKATNDIDEFVAQSALVALLNLDYLSSKPK